MMSLSADINEVEQHKQVLSSAGDKNTYMKGLWELRLNSGLSRYTYQDRFFLSCEDKNTT